MPVLIDNGFTPVVMASHSMDIYHKVLCITKYNAAVITVLMFSMDFDRRKN